MKQFSKLLAAFHHCKMVVFSGIKITDPDSSFRTSSKLQYSVRHLYFLSKWDAKLYEKVLKGISQNQSLKANCQIDFEASDPDVINKVTDVAKNHGISIL